MSGIDKKFETGTGLRGDPAKNDFMPTASMETLRKRAEVVSKIRKFFDERNFFEVETPLISGDIVVDRYLQPIGLSRHDVTGAEEDRDKRLWLQTSPEFGMKRLVTSGATAIYQICKAFRQSEKGNRHNPEFTMLEWYRVGDDLEGGMTLLADFAETMLGVPNCGYVSYQHAFKRHANIDPFVATVDELADVVSEVELGVELKATECHRDEFLNLILSEIVEPKLGLERPEIIFDWPASQAALAVVRDDGDMQFAERFELYVNGVELANGYHELLDAEELLHRNSINNQLRIKDGQSLLPESSRLVSAMQNGMPACAGVALGVDRLMMLVLGVETIQDVIAFPIDRA